MRALNLPPAYRLIALDTVDSTNAEAKRLAAKGEAEIPDGTLIVAAEQTAGRGRRGRKWASPRGNLYFSLVLRPEAPLAKAAELSFVASLALYDALTGVGPAGFVVHCKWPNDVLLNQHKVAGILLEAETGKAAHPDWVILGVGLNVAEFPAKAEFPASSLRAQGWNVSPEDCLEAFCRHFMVWTNTWLSDGFPPIRKNWLWRCWGKGEKIEVRLADKTVKGVFADLDQDGALLLNTGKGQRKITAGDVFFPKA